MDNISVLEKISCMILQGRDDFITPPLSSFELSQKLLHAQYILIDGAGHSSQEGPVLDTIVRATHAMKALLI